MSLTLGEKLRQSREERGISISEVAEQTRISPHYLESIEKNDFKPLPGGIFNKGFVRSFARYVGLDENEALRDYAATLGTSEEDEQEIPRTYRPEVLTDDRTGPSNAPTIIFAVLILALMTGGLLFAVNYLRNWGSNSPTSPTPVTQASNSIANSNAANAVVAAAPQTDKISVELKAVAEPVWIKYTVDGTPKIQTLAPDETVKLEPKDSFSISYSKAKLPNLQIMVNGKTLSAPASEGKGTIDIEVNKANVQQIMLGGEATPPSAPSSPATSAGPEPTKSEPATTSKHEPSVEKTPAKTPKPTPTVKPIVPKPILSPTPIIIGKPTPAKHPN